MPFQCAGRLEVYVHFARHDEGMMTGDDRGEDPTSQLTVPIHAVAIVRVTRPVASILIGTVHGCACS